MTIRDWILVIYCALLLAGAAAIWKRNDVGHDDFAAARDLPLNWRLQPGDIQRDLLGTATTPGKDTALEAFTGRYLRGALQRNEVVHLRQTDAVPVIVPLPGHVATLAPFESSTVAGVNAGSCVALDGPDKAPVKVSAVLCPEAAHPACEAILDLTTARLAAMTAGGKSLPQITGTAHCTPP